MTGAALIAIGSGLITLWDENSGRAPQICYMIIAGLGIGRKLFLHIAVGGKYFFENFLLTLL